MIKAISHAAKNYICPACLVIKGIENEHVATKQQDIFYKDRYITAFISSHWWPNNPGHVMIVPNQHFENIYDIPDDLLSKIHLFAKKVCIAFKEIYSCEGTSIRQHNEPAGNQDVFHYHVQVLPRYNNDKLYLNNNEKQLMLPEKRLVYAEKLKRYFGKALLS